MEYASQVPPKQTPVHEQPDYLRMILTARVYEIINETPLQEAVNLNTKLGSKIYLKREDLNPVFSFKIRGAYNRLAHLTDEEKKKGVIACSAGNVKPNGVTSDLYFS